MKKASRPKIIIYQVHGVWYWKFSVLFAGISLLYAGPYQSKESAKRSALRAKRLMASAEIEEEK
jgi:hypothetical protein